MNQFPCIGIRWRRLISWHCISAKDDHSSQEDHNSQEYFGLYHAWQIHSGLLWELARLIASITVFSIKSRGSNFQSYNRFACIKTNVASVSQYRYSTKPVFPSRCKTSIDIFLHIKSAPVRYIFIHSLLGASSRSLYVVPGFKFGT